MRRGHDACNIQPARRSPLAVGIGIAAFALVLMMGAEALGCPSCRESVAGTDDTAGTRMAAGYFWSILLMLSVPYLLFAGGATAAYMTWRRHQQHLAAASPTTLTPPDATASVTASPTVPSQTHPQPQPTDPQATAF